LSPETGGAAQIHISSVAEVRAALKQAIIPSILSEYFCKRHPLMYVTYDG